jgi:hypothetical protein
MIKIKIMIMIMKRSLLKRFRGKKYERWFRGILTPRIGEWDIPAAPVEPAGSVARPSPAFTPWERSVYV